MVTTTIAIARRRYRQLTMAALEERAAITEIVREAVDQWLADRASRRRPRKR